MPKIPPKRHNEISTPITTPAFITGSQAYGMPTPASDTDMVILCDEETLWLLKKIADKVDLDHVQETDAVDYPNVNSVSLRFGKLNILACLNEKAYQLWSQATKELMEKANIDNPLILATRVPIKRVDACAYIAAKRKKAYGESNDGKF